MRHAISWATGGVALAAVLAVAAFPGAIGRGAARVAIERRAGVDATRALPDGLHVALCGTGSPMPDPTRAGPCSVVIAGRRMFAVDAGEGGARNIMLMGIPNGRIEGVFLTHLHSDHIDGLGPVLLLAWTGAGRTRPLPVYGPAGTDRVVAGFNQAYAIDAGFRTAHHGTTIAPPSGTGGEALPFALPPKGDWSPVTVFEGDGLTVTAFRVDHGPVEPAVGYRFSYKGRSIVFSGDTSPTPSIVRNARGADLLVHEGLQPRLVGLMTEALDQRRQTALTQITRDILNYHTSPEDAAAEAQAAGVKHLVFSHNIPPLPSRLMYPAFLGDARQRFGGTIMVGEDGMVLSLPAGGTGMELRRWSVR
ncbi:MAG: MBL fold metallo-hydrolase [Candidatus Sphingomonas colombiensis]|nr:MBL fold metallo-hydrolase [Sphingomonas sp.]WEK44028.1 MAG: MBL fold metallo-hydrolase [Sphingomonas sp.]